MRPATFVALLVVPLLACEPDVKVFETSVAWMDWPADVIAGTPFKVRLVVQWPCASDGFRAGPQADQSAVTFSPYFLHQDDQILCLVAGNVDTTGVAPGLGTSNPRTFEMRATIFALTLQPLLVPGGLPVRTFGEVTVRLPGSAMSARRNAGGTVVVEVDSLGCTRLRPVGLYTPNATLVLENPTDTAGLSGRFVRGYIHNAPAPICGETRVFHLVAVN